MSLQISDYLTLAVILVTATYVILNGFMLRTMRDEGRKGAAARVHDLLWRLLMEYRSPQMLLAIDTLWRLHGTHSSNLADAYEQIRRDESDAIALLPPAQQAEAAAGTLHHRRRLVSHFYQFLAALREMEAIPEPVLYTHWFETDLRIIPDILVPIEERLAREFKTDSNQFRSQIGRLMALYERSK